jgi:hypothetical protein
MSSTTGVATVQGEKFYTPPLLARAIVSWVATDFYRGMGPKLILEPSVGAGAFVFACKEMWPDSLITGVDSDPEAPGFAVIDDPIRQRFENAAVDRVDLTIGNPPFSLAEEHSAKANALTLGGIVALLLRTAFFHGKKRDAFWAKYPPAKEYRLVERPSFTGGGTDSAEYSVFVFTPGRKVPFCVTERRSWK